MVLASSPLLRLLSIAAAVIHAGSLSASPRGPGPRTGCPTGTDDDPTTERMPFSPPVVRSETTVGRRDALIRGTAASFLCAAAAAAPPPLLPDFVRTRNTAFAYDPDSDPVRESLYFVSRVQEATVQQERFVNGATDQAALKSKMKLTLRLVEKNYRLLDQITYLSAYVDPESLVEATTAGQEAAEALQAAIDYVKGDLGAGSMGDEQRKYLTENLTTCREELFHFLRFVPQEKLREARDRVENENSLNREEYDGDGTEGVYNPVVLPWKNRPL